MQPVKSTEYKPMESTYNTLSVGEAPLCTSACGLPQTLSTESWPDGTLFRLGSASISCPYHRDKYQTIAASPCFGCSLFAEEPWLEFDPFICSFFFPHLTESTRCTFRNHGCSDSSSCKLLELSLSRFGFLEMG
jgi:hypothetical protein